MHLLLLHRLRLWMLTPLRVRTLLLLGELRPLRRLCRLLLHERAAASGILVRIAHI